MRFNANAVLVSTWPWAIACFALAMRTGRTRHALAAGLLCGLALLAKYFSAVLITSLVLAALLHAPWRAPISWIAPSPAHQRASRPDGFRSARIRAKPARVPRSYMRLKAPTGHDAETGSRTSWRAVQ
jgi:hypothetical protein